MVSAASSALPAELSLPQSDLDRLDLPEQSDLQELSSPAVSVGSSASLLEALELPARLEALAKCDAAVTPYDPDSFRIVFALEGRNADAIVWPLALLLIWGIVAASILEAVPGLRDSLVPIEDVFSPLLTTISFLLVFRLGRAAVRYWDARAAAGKMVEICRVLASDSAVACAALPELRAELASVQRRWAGSDEARGSAARGCGRLVPGRCESATLLTLATSGEQPQPGALASSALYRCSYSFSRF